MFAAFPTKYWHAIDDNKVQCDLCPRHCHLKEGQRGFCYVRACENGEVVLKTYGHSSGYCIDPIEKKPLNHFLPGVPVLSFGTVGCNLGCKFCQNWDISKAREQTKLAKHASPLAIAKAAQKFNCQAVAFTYNDPIIFLEYAVDTAKECHKLGIKTVAVTSGYIDPEPRVEFFQHMDAANVDLKGFSEEFYQKLTSAKLQPVLDTLVYLVHETKVWLEITTLLIPGHNDSDQELDAMTKWIAKELGVDIPLHFSAFHPAWKMQDVPRTPLTTLHKARDIALKNGLRYVYTGNVLDTASSSTYCHNCGACVIKRSAYSILAYDLGEHGCCQNCHTKCAGVFAGSPGNWGNKQLPININEGS